MGDNVIATKALVMSELERSGAIGYLEKKALTFNGDITDKYTFVHGTFRYVQVSNAVIDAKTVTKITAMIGGVPQEFSVAETQELTESVMLVYVPYGGSIVPAVVICTDNTGDYWKKGVSALYDPNGDAAGVPIWVSRIETETTHPIDPKFLPGVCLPVVEITSAEYPESGTVSLSAEEGAQIEKATETAEFVIVKIHIPDGVPDSKLWTIWEFMGAKHLVAENGAKVIMNDNGTWTMGV